MTECAMMTLVGATDMVPGATTCESATTYCFVLRRRLEKRLRIELGLSLVTDGAVLGEFGESGVTSGAK